MGFLGWQLDRKLNTKKPALKIGTKQGRDYSQLKYAGRIFGRHGQF
jgi:hypothetical protein